IQLRNKKMTLKEVLKECKQNAINSKQRYDFWVVSDTVGNVINDDFDYEGGYEIPLDTHFRNTFSFYPDGSFQKNFEADEEFINDINQALSEMETVVKYFKDIT
ncbi:MAG: hypothetical protein ACOCP8_05100, partial [archaeon]